MTSPWLETLTFLFTDLESSTRLWETHPDAMKEAVERHDGIMRQAVENAGGRVVKATGDGLLAVFESAPDAAAACLAAQRALRDEPWEATGPLRVRMGVHAGDAQARGGDYYGPTLNRTARIMAAGHGGQVLLSALAAELVRGRLPADATLRDLGEHRLKDLSRAEHLFQLLHPALPADFPPLATLSDRPNNLPTQTSEFLGRETQLRALRDLVDAPAIRIVTLAGPGGIGKTRLALQAAADQIDRFEDGVYFVDLSPIRNPNAVFDAAARALGLTGDGDEDPLDVLKRELRASRTLLLLDNFEQVMDAADGVAQLLQHCPGVKVLVTSREALRVRGEHVFPVPPLSVPEGATARLTADDAVAYETVRLFVERARAARPDFELTDENAPAIGEIAARLDGLPLAIELAAARLNLFSPQELRDRLRSRLELLGRGARDLPARQRTLRATIEWSYELLDGDERALLRVLSVFGPARAEAVEEIVARLEPLADVDAIDGLASLVDKNLVRVLERRSGRRLTLLETVREYARERLDEDVALADAARRAHAEHFTELVRSRRPRLSGADRDDALDELEGELGNLLAAWRHWLEACDLEQLDDLLDGLWILHDARGWYHAMIGLTNDLLGALASGPATPDRVSEQVALHVSLARVLLAIRGYTDEVEEAYRRAVELAEQAGEVPQRIPVLRSLAAFYMYRAELDKANEVGRRILDLAVEQGDRDSEVDGNLLVGLTDAFTVDVRTGLERLAAAIALFDPDRHHPRRFGIGPSPGVVAHTTSALLLWTLGEPQQAVELAQRGVDLADRLKHPFTRAYALFHVGLLDFWRREPERACERARAVLEVAEEHDYTIWRALAMVLEGASTAVAGRPEEGIERLEEGVALYEGRRTPPIFWPLLLSIRAAAWGSAGRPDEAFAFVDEALAITGGEDLEGPSLLLLAGDLLLQRRDAAEARARFERALAIAERHAVRMPLLGALTRLVRLAPEGPARAETAARLRAVYDTFPEGFDARDLADARAALDEVGAGVV